MGLIVISKKGYLFLRCMYILKTSKLLRGEWRKKSLHNSQSASQSPSPVRAHKFFHSLKRDVPLSSCRCGPGGQHHAGRARFFLYFTQMSHSFSEDTSYFFFVSFHHTLRFEHVSIFNTCDLGWFPGALFSC